MLTPVVVRASFKITTTELVVLETLVAGNLPLLFPEVQIMNRTPTTDSVDIVGTVRTVFTNQPDPDFNGTVTFKPFLDFSVGDGSTVVLTGLGNSLLPTPQGITTEISITHIGPAAESRITLIVQGMIETGVSPDAAVSINV